MYAIFLNNIQAVKHVLATYKDKLNLQIVNNNDETAYDYSIKLGYYHIANVIRLSNLGIVLKNKIKNYENNNLMINSISNLFNYHLKLNCKLLDDKNNKMKQQKKDKVMKILNINSENDKKKDDINDDSMTAVENGK